MTTIGELFYISLGFAIGAVVGHFAIRWVRRRSQRRRERDAIERWAQICGVKQRPGESLPELRVRIMSAMAGRRDA